MLSSVCSIRKKKKITGLINTLIPRIIILAEDGGKAEDPHGQRETQQKHHAERKRGQDAGESSLTARHRRDSIPDGDVLPGVYEAAACPWWWSRVQLWVNCHYMCGFRPVCERGLPCDKAVRQKCNLITLRLPPYNVTWLYLPVKYFVFKYKKNTEYNEFFKKKSYFLKKL